MRSDVNARRVENGLGGPRVAVHDVETPPLAIPAALATVALAVIVAACSSATGSPGSVTAPPPARATPAASSAPSPTVQVTATAGPALEYTNVAYASTSSAQVLDLWIPDRAAAPVPLVVFVHPGAFMFGDKAMEVGNVASVLAAGYAAASLNYRLTGAAPFPAAVQDVKAAVRFLRANAAQYGLDPDRFAAWGESAGGNLVAMIGTTGDQSTVLDDPSLGNAGVSSAVQAVVDFYGPTDFLQLDAQFAAAQPAACNGQFPAYDPADSPASAYLGAAIQTVPDQAAAADPITYIATAQTLPVFLIAHGGSDCEIPNQQSQILQDALQAAGATSAFNLVDGAGHGDPAITTSQTPIALAMLKSVFGE